MELSEADTRAKLIDPKIHGRGWTEDLIRREVTLGPVEVVQGKGRRRSAGRTDYTLRVKVNSETQPVAVAMLEAKKESLPPQEGLSQAKGYLACQRHNVQFVFATNGHLFVEYDRSTRMTTEPKPLSEFPTPAELRARYEWIVGFSLESAAAKPLLARYAGGEGQRRYFQDAAIRAVFEKVARSAQKNEPARALLSLATGTGKTFIACNMLKRIADAGQLKRALFLCDRDELRVQALAAMRRVFGSDAVAVSEDADGKNVAKNARVHIATYQTLGIDQHANDDATANGPINTDSFLTRHYPVDYFSHIVIDECHRSAWGSWSEVLKRNPNAVQIGLTATPRKLKFSKCVPEGAPADDLITANNFRYFGEPVYEYGLAQAMEDGYLAACEIQLAEVNLDATGLSGPELVTHNPRNAITGAPATAAEIADAYQKTDYETALLIPDRVNAMCLDLFKSMIAADPERGPHQKTIIFCARDLHADNVATAMNNLYVQWCNSKGIVPKSDYAFKCTDKGGGQSLIADFKSSASSHFIATTVDLLTTGVDVPAVRNIAFFRYLSSAIAFYQMVGRGTRIDEASGKLLFTIYDYTGATRLFGVDFETEARTKKQAANGPNGNGDPPPPPPAPLMVDNFEVQISPVGRFVLAPVGDGGKAMPVPVEDYKAALSERLVAECPTLESFRARWVNPPAREDLIAGVVAAGYSPTVVQVIEKMNDYDLYDVLVDLAYGMSPSTREQRALAFTYKNAKWLGQFPAPVKATLSAIADQFKFAGTAGLESEFVFDLPEVQAAGGLSALAAIMEPVALLLETKHRMFAA